MKLSRDDADRDLMMKFIADIRDVIFDDAPWSTQLDMIGSPLDVLLYAKAWIQDAKDELDRLENE